MTGNLADIVRRAAREHPDASAMIAESGSWTWTQLDTAADVGAAVLRGRGLRPGERVVVSMPTSAELAVAMIAAVRADLILVPVDPDRSDLSDVVDRVSATGMIADIGAGATVAIGRTDVAGWFGRSAQPVDPQRSGEDIAVLGRATKAGQVVMISHRAVLAAISAIVAAPQLAPRSDDRVLQALPLFHLAGLVTVFLPSAAVGAAVVVPGAPPVSPRDIGSGAWTRFGTALLTTVREHRVTLLPGAPPLYQLLLRAAEFESSLTSVRVLTSAASPLQRADALAVRTRTGQPVWEGYGISESSSVVCSTLMCDEPRPGSVGPPLPGVEVRIETTEDASDDTLDDSVVSVDVDADPGRITVRGPQLFSGYWPDGTGAPDGDGWFATSDVGYLDDRGELHLIDRLPETLVVSGFTVYPREVESALLSHPQVRDVAVVGVPGGGGTQLVATLVLHGEDIGVDEWSSYLEPLLPAFKRPTGYRVVAALPRTELGRLDRGAVAADWAEHLGIEMADDIDESGTKLAVLAGGQPTSTQQPPEQPTEPPEVIEVSYLDRLGSRLPGISGRSRRSAQDTDFDLFDEDLLLQTSAAEQPSDQPTVDEDLSPTPVPPT